MVTSSTSLVTIVHRAAVFAVWVANRKRIAAETVGRAEEQAARIVKTPSATPRRSKKEALLEAKEKAHEILTTAERQARQDRQQAQTLEQTLTRREAAARRAPGRLSSAPRRICRRASVPSATREKRSRQPRAARAARRRSSSTSSSAWRA